MESVNNVLTNIGQSVNSVSMNLQGVDSSKTSEENQAEQDFSKKTPSNPLNTKTIESVENGKKLDYGPIFRLVNGKYIQIGAEKETQKQLVKGPGGLFFSVNSKGQFECKACGVSFTTYNELSDHQNNGIKYHCGLCKLFFNCKESVKLHLQTHVAGSSAQNSIKHTPLHFPHKPKEDSQLQCKECDQSFSSESTLKRHMKTHSKLMTCDKCGKQFSMDNFLIHTKSSKCSKRKTVFKCKECKKKFSQVGALNLHMNTHTKPFNCDECGKRFSQKKAMEHHETSRKCIRYIPRCIYERFVGFHRRRLWNTIKPLVNASWNVRNAKCHF